MSKRKQTPDLMGDEGESDALADLLGQRAKSKEEPQPEPKPKRRTSRDRLAGRATYDLSPELKEAIAQRATRLGIPASQLAHFLLLHAWRLLEQGQIDPEPYLVPSTSPAFRNNLDVEAVVEVLGEG